jgi:hypothetical protein
MRHTLFAISMLLMRPAHAQAPNGATKGPAFSVDTSKYVVLKLGKPSKTFGRRVKEIASTQEMIDGAEAIIARLRGRLKQPDTAFLDSLKDLGMDRPYDMSILSVDLKGTYRQYASAVDKKGNQLIYLNGFCRVDPTGRWRDQWVVVHDGWFCYFHAIIDLRHNSVVRLWVNGVG